MIGLSDGQEGAMVIRDIFASNLRRLCEQRGSINHVCRQTGIHRQQFALYLKGDRLPNKKTLGRLSSYFDVPEDAFFVDPTQTRPASSVDRTCGTILERMRAFPPSMPQGLYQTYFWAPALGDAIVGALTAIRQTDGVLGFRRLTAAGERLDPTWTYVKGDHQGIVSERMGWLYFQSSNRIEPREPTLLAVRWAALSEPLLVGHGMVISHLGPMVVSVVMIPLGPNQTLLSAIRRTRVFNFEDPKLSLVVRFLKQRILY
jgi:transcriptional regulator with XRE-family HTH domain